MISTVGRPFYKKGIQVTHKQKLKKVQAKVLVHGGDVESRFSHFWNAHRISILCVGNKHYQHMLLRDLLPKGAS